MKNVNTMSETEKKARTWAFEWIDKHVDLQEKYRQYTFLEDLEIPEIIEWLEDEDIYGKVPVELYASLKAC